VTVVLEEANLKKEAKLVSETQCIVLISIHTTEKVEEVYELKSR
jgi:hypothetical protein